MARIKLLIAVTVIFCFLALSFLPAGPLSIVSSGVSCPTNATSGNGDTFSVVVTGNDGSCPSTYSQSGVTHYALSTGAAQNPYTVTLSSCSGTSCPPTEIIIQGWAGNQVVCGGTEPACSSTGPWTFTVDATVQAGEACNTAPVKVTGTSGSPVLILEAGEGGVCSGATTTTTSLTTETVTTTDPITTTSTITSTSYATTTIPTTVSSTTTALSTTTLGTTTTGTQLTTTTTPTTSTQTTSTDTTVTVPTTTTLTTYTTTTGVCSTPNGIGAVPQINSNSNPLVHSNPLGGSSSGAETTSVTTITVPSTVTTTLTVRPTSTATQTDTVTVTVPTTSTQTVTDTSTSIVPVTSTATNTVTSTITVPTTVTNTVTETSSTTASSTVTVQSTGTVSTCTTSTTQTGVPEFPAFGGFLLLLGLSVPLVLVMRRRLPQLSR